MVSPPLAISKQHCSLLCVFNDLFIPDDFFNDKEKRINRNQRSDRQSKFIHCPPIEMSVQNNIKVNDSLNHSDSQSQKCRGFLEFKNLLDRKYSQVYPQKQIQNVMKSQIIIKRFKHLTTLSRKQKHDQAQRPSLVYIHHLGGEAVGAGVFHSQAAFSRSQPAYYY